MMKSDYHIVLIGGWCGNLIYVVAEGLRELLEKNALQGEITTHSVYGSFNPPPDCKLILQLVPAFNKDEVKCPIINVRPLLVDSNHETTINAVLNQVRNDTFLN